MPKRKAEDASDASEDDKSSKGKKKTVTGDEKSIVACEVRFSLLRVPSVILL